MAYSFNGTTQYLIQGSQLGTLDAFSIALWVKTTETAGGGGANAIYGVQKNGASPLDFFNVQINTNNAFGEEADTLMFHVRDDSDGDDVADFNDTVINDGSWHHHCLTRDGAATAYFLDGSSKTLDFSSDGLTTASVILNEELAFAARNIAGTVGAFTTCSLSDIAIYSVALSAGQIASLIAGVWPPSIATIRNYYPLLDGALTDIVGGNNLSAVASPSVVAGPLT